jgi:uncharacterized membrane protein YGL010W
MDPSPEHRRATSLAALLSSYAKYHQDPRNRRTHFVGVPLITFSLLTVLAFPTLSLLGVHIRLERVATVALVVFYLYLDVPLGLALAVALALLAVLAEATVRLGTTFAVTTALVSFIGGWALQLLGHRLEGNKPALLNNIRQIFIAPIYLMAESAFALGLRRDLQGQIDQRIGASAAAH